jgi:rhodanese-related sulfurtransferase
LQESINKEELLEKINRKERFHLVDVRDTPDYQERHIVGAENLLISEMNREAVEAMFDKHDLIITYSLDINCPAKNIAAKKLRNLGFKNVLAYQGSWKEWEEAGYPTERV